MSSPTAETGIPQLDREPAPLERAYLIAADFDGTVADTFAPGPLGLEVETAYQKAVAEVFGPQAARLYEAQGGLQNRSPGEIVASVINDHWPVRSAMAHGYDFLAAHRTELAAVMPAGKGASFDDLRATVALTEVLVCQKLRHLNRQVGPDGDEVWPRPIPGFREFYESLPASVDFAIVSSGHDDFIRRVFELWELPPPAIIVSDDDLRGRSLPEDPAARAKPGQLPMALAMRQWMQQRAGREYFTLGEAAAAKARVVCVGDDPVKDGQFAANNGVTFVERGDPNLDHYAFQDWRGFGRLLESRAIGLAAARPMHDLLPVVGAPEHR